MTRKLWIFIHLYLAAFFSPMVVLMALTGGLYLVGIKGAVDYQTLGVVDRQITPGADLEEQVDAALAEFGIDASFAYVKDGGDAFTTRPTSRTHYKLVPGADRTEVLRGRPDLVSALIELHKGHGPPLFKWYQKVFAVGLVLIVASGVYLGLQAPGLRRRALITTAAGIAVLLVLAST